MTRIVGLLLLLPVILAADVTIRYTTTMSGAGISAANQTGSRTVYMKGSMGAMIQHGQITIVDFARQRVTIADAKAKVFATVPSAEFAAATAEPETAEEAEVHKSQKATCQKTSPVAVAETIQGIKAQEYDVTCATTTAAPGMAIRSLRKLWVATPDERLRVPGLWQLSGFESWQENFMMPSAGAEDGVEKTMMDALRKGQSATLREKTEMSMQLPGSTGADGYTQVFGTTEEMVSISTELVDDSVFRVPASFREEPMSTVWKGLGAEAIAEVTVEKDAAPQPPIPENVKAFISTLFPLNSAEAESPTGPDGKLIQGEVQYLLTINPQGNVEQIEVLTGPEALREAATKAVRQYTFRPVLRNGVAVTAYTSATVNFIDYKHGPPDMSAFSFTPEMEAAEDRLQQLETAFPRSLEQQLADIEQDSGGGDNERRYIRLGEMALKSIRLGADEKGKAYATELLAAGVADGHSWNYGNSIHDGHIALGLMALHRDDVSVAAHELLEAGKTPGSPTLNSFGPNMELAGKLLKKVKLKWCSSISTSAGNSGKWAPNGSIPGQQPSVTAKFLILAPRCGSSVAHSTFATKQLLYFRRLRRAENTLIPLKKQDFPWQNGIVANIARGTGFVCVAEGSIATQPASVTATGVRCFVLLAALTAFSAIASASWLATGPFGGDADIVRAIPGTKGHVIAAARNGLVFSSTNGGASWVNLPFPAQFAGVLHALEVDPKSTSIWYAGVESEIGRVSGVYRTIDSGTTWSQLPGTVGIGVWSLALWPGDNNVIAAGTSTGVYLTRDAGADWKKISADGDTELQPVVSLAFQPSDSKILYAGTTHLPWKTTDGGATWESIHTGMLDDSDVFSIVVDPKNAEHVMASACSGVYNSLDGAQHWAKLDTPPGAFRTHFVALDPRHEGVVFAGTTDGLLKSVNGGHAWRKVSPYSVHSLAYDSDLESRIFFAASSGTATPGGLLVSNDEGNTLRESDYGFTNRNFTTLTGSGLALYSSSVYEAGSGGAYRTENFAARWEHASGPAGDELVRMASAPDDPKRLYAAGYHGLFESRDGGQHWTARKMPSDSPVTSLMPLRGGELLAGTASGLFRSNETGAWSSVTGTSIQSIQRSSQDVVAALTATGGMVSQDAGLTWTSCGDAGPDRSWNGLAFDMVGRPAHPIALAATSTGLYRSTDGCKSWSAVRKGLDNATVSLVLFHPTHSGEAFISQGGRIFVSTDGGQRWQPIDDETDHSPGGNASGFGGPASLVVLSAAPDTLFALFPRRGVYTTGIGFWTATLPDQPSKADQAAGKSSVIKNTERPARPRND